MEGSFSSKAYSERSRAYASALLSNVSKEITARSLPEGKRKFVVLFFEPLASKCIERASQNITLRGSTDAPMIADKLYRFLALIFSPHGTRLSTRKAIEVRHAANVAMNSFDEVLHVQKNLFMYPLTQRADMVDDTGSWSGGRDVTGTCLISNQLLFVYFV